jgi:glutathione S-transferase
VALELLGAGVSPFVRKVRAVCAEKGLEYTYTPVSPFNPPAGWREVSPLGKIPALRHDGRVVNDSSVICAYLERIHPEPALYPKAPYDYARALWIEEFVDGGIFPILAPNVFLPVVLRPVLTRTPPAADVIQAAEKAVNEQLAPLFAYLDQQLTGAQYFVGNTLSIADLSVGSAFVNLRHAGFRADPARFPQLAAFVERMHGRPSLSACIAEEKPVFGQRWV